MHLKRYTDFSLRVLMYLGLHRERLVTIAEIATAFAISRNHLMKVAQNLTASGFVRSVPGKNGGLALARKPADINLGQVVRQMEGNFEIVECFNPDDLHCRILPVCGLKALLGDATDRFLESLDQYTIQDLLKRKGALSRLTSPNSIKATDLLDV
jgi:Rrf2 family transcriptional regulator, nitric oxide-sensitive transcriptional repressor